MKKLGLTVLVSLCWLLALWVVPCSILHQDWGRLMPPFGQSGDEWFQWVTGLRVVKAAPSKAAPSKAELEKAVLECYRRDCAELASLPRDWPSKCKDARALAKALPEMEAALEVRKQREPELKAAGVSAGTWLLLRQDEEMAQDLIADVKARLRELQ